MTRLQLPVGWKDAKIGEVATLIRGVSYKKEDAASNPADGMVPILRATNIHQALTFDDPVYVPTQNVSSEQMLTVGDSVIAASSGSRAVVGKSAPLRHSWQGAFGAFCYVLRPHSVNPFYLAYFLQTSEYRNRVSQLSAGVNINNLKRHHIEQMPFPLAPSDEQDRIVAEIEKQFTRIEAGVAGLRHAQKLLTIHRRSLLEAAVAGRLVPTTDSIAQTAGGHYAPASLLLEAILRRRRELWDEARGAGVVKAGYKEPMGANVKALPPLPRGWTWATAEQLSDETRSITYGVIKLGDHQRDGVSVLRSSNVRSLRLDFEGLKRIAPQLSNDYRRTILRGGEVVLTVRGTLGGVVSVPSTCAGFNISREVAMIAFVDERLAMTVAAFIASPQLQRWLMTRTRGIAYTGINIETLKTLPIPLPPLDEQGRINDELARRLSVAEALGMQLRNSISQAAGLRRSMLSAAFSGQLSTALGQMVTA